MESILFHWGIYRSECRVAGKEQCCWVSLYQVATVSCSNVSRYAVFGQLFGQWETLAELGMGLRWREW